MDCAPPYPSRLGDFERLCAMVEVYGNDLPVASLVLGGITNFGWTLAYLLIIHRAWKDKLPGVPLVPMCVMWSFEAVMVLVWRTDVMLWWLFEVTWLFLDTILVAQALRYQGNVFSNPHMKRWSPGIVLFTLSGAFVGVYAFMEWTGLTEGVVPALIAAAVIAASFPRMFTDRQERGMGRRDGISVPGAVLRSVADLATAVGTWVVWRWVWDPRIATIPPAPDFGYHASRVPVSPNTPFTSFLLTVVLASDVLLLYLLWARARRERRAAA